MEKIFEGGLWSSRFMIILAVIFGIVGATVLFIVASVDVFNSAEFVYTTYVNHAHP